jgi:hypothetical protein
MSSADREHADAVVDAVAKGEITFTEGADASCRPR